MDASKQPRPDPWPALLGEGRTIVAADIVCSLPFKADRQIYDPDLVPAIISTLSILLQSGSTALVAATVRNITTLELFIDTCSKHFPLYQLISRKPWLDGRDTGSRTDE
jgi:hypothetical protein